MGGRLLLGAIVVACTACAPVVLGSDDYRSAGARSVADASAQVASAKLVGELARDDRAYRSYLTVVVGDAEDALSGIADRFAGLQPPSPADEELRPVLIDALSSAQDSVSEMRVDLTAGRIPDESLIEDLASTQDTLERLAGEVR